MSNISIDEFVASLSKSGAIDSAVADDRLADVSQFPSAKHLARSLVTDELLTEWQAKFLLSGRHRLKIGNYLLLNRIKRDEFGDRFQALHTSLDRKVVMQIFSKDVSKDVARRKAVIKKASLVSKLDHPNLVHVYDIDHEGDRYFIIVEHTSANPIDVSQTMGLSEPEIAHLIKQCVSGLFYAHQNDVIHGSIAPNDLLLAEDGTVKIQNLSMQPLRNDASDGYQPSENDDFVAISNIGLKLLKANESVEPHPNRQSLKEILAKLRKNPEVVAGELDQWIAENPKREVSTAPLVTAAPTRSGAHRTRSSGENKIPDDPNPTEGELKGFAKAWSNNPVGMIAAMAVPLIILGVIGLVVVQKLTSPSLAQHSSTNLNSQEASVDESTDTSDAAPTKKSDNNKDKASNSNQPKKPSPANAAAEQKPGQQNRAKVSSNLSNKTNPRRKNGNPAECE